MSTKEQMEKCPICGPGGTGTCTGDHRCSDYDPGPEGTKPLLGELLASDYARALFPKGLFSEGYHSHILPVPQPVFVASDHNGTAARNYVCHVLERIGFKPIDLGPAEYDGKVDYPDMAAKVCEKVLETDTRGILICGTGAGMVMAANTFKGIRAALGVDRPTGELMRQHNNANVLVLGQWVTPLGKMEEIIQAFLSTPFEAGRHIPRVEKLEALKK